MALDFNELIKAAHVVAKPYIMKGLKAGIDTIEKKIEETGTIADNLLWADVKEAFQVSE